MIIIMITSSCQPTTGWEPFQHFYASDDSIILPLGSWVASRCFFVSLVTILYSSYLARPLRITIFISSDNLVLVFIKKILYFRLGHISICECVPTHSRTFFTHEAANLKMLSVSISLFLVNRKLTTLWTIFKVKENVEWLF